MFRPLEPPHVTDQGLSGESAPGLTGLAPRSANRPSSRTFIKQVAETTLNQENIGIVIKSIEQRGLFFAEDLIDYLTKYAKSPLRVMLDFASTSLRHHPGLVVWLWRLRGLSSGNPRSSSPDWRSWLFHNLPDQALHKLAIVEFELVSKGFISPDYFIELVSSTTGDAQLADILYPSQLDAQMIARLREAVMRASPTAFQPVHEPSSPTGSSCSALSSGHFPSFQLHHHLSAPSSTSRSSTPSVMSSPAPSSPNRSPVLSARFAASSPQPSGLSSSSVQPEMLMSALSLGRVDAPYASSTYSSSSSSALSSSHRYPFQQADHDAQSDTWSSSAVPSLVSTPQRPLSPVGGLPPTSSSAMSAMSLMGSPMGSKLAAARSEVSSPIVSTFLGAGPQLRIEFDSGDASQDQQQHPHHGHGVALLSPGPVLRSRLTFDAEYHGDKDEDHADPYARVAGDGVLSFLRADERKSFSRDDEYLWQGDRRQPAATATAAGVSPAKPFAARALYPDAHTTQSQQQQSGPTRPPLLRHRLTSRSPSPQLSHGHHEDLGTHDDEEDAQELMEEQQAHQAHSHHQSQRAHSGHQQQQQQRRQQQQQHHDDDDDDDDDENAPVACIICSEKDHKWRRCPRVVPTERLYASTVCRMGLRCPRFVRLARKASTRHGARRLQMTMAQPLPPNEKLPCGFAHLRGPREAQTPAERKICKICNVMGHVRAECANTLATRFVCQRCGTQGHDEFVCHELHLLERVGAPGKDQIWRYKPGHAPISNVHQSSPAKSAAAAAAAAGSSSGAHHHHHQHQHQSSHSHSQHQQQQYHLPSTKPIAPITVSATPAAAAIAAAVLAPPVISASHRGAAIQRSAAAAASSASTSAYNPGSIGHYSSADHESSSAVGGGGWSHAAPRSTGSAASSRPGLGGFPAESAQHALRHQQPQQQQPWPFAGHVHEQQQQQHQHQQHYHHHHSQQQQQQQHQQPPFHMSSESYFPSTFRY